MERTGKGNLNITDVKLWNKGERDRETYRQRDRETETERKKREMFRGNDKYTTVMKNLRVFGLQ